MSTRQTVRLPRSVYAVMIATVISDIIVTIVILKYFL